MPLFQNDDAAYIAWLDAHPNGFAVNTDHEPSERYLVLHRSTCGKARQQNPTSTTYSKFGAETVEDAQNFAAGLNGDLHPCGICHPMVGEVV